MTYMLHTALKKYIRRLRPLLYADFVFNYADYNVKYFIVSLGYTDDNHAICFWFLYFNVHLIWRQKQATHLYKRGSLTYTLDKTPPTTCGTTKEQDTLSLQETRNFYKDTYHYLPLKYFVACI